MTRDHPTTLKTSKSFSAGPNYHHHHNHHHHHHKIAHFEPFHLLSHDDKLLKQAAELVESVSLSREKVCVIAIVSKDSLDESMQNYLAQSILRNKTDKRRHRGKQNVKNDHPPKADEASIQTNIDKSLESVSEFENQVVGFVDSRSDVIVLNLTSFTNSSQICSLYEAVDELSRIDIGTQPPLSSNWPKWNQNLIKTLLILLIMSHIVVFYNPEPSIDYNLIQIFKILETVRLKSQSRITDLLETIASKQMFSQNWIRQGRVSCPRALFVCDASRLGLTINQSDVINIKRDLEDQIHKLLKKTNILAKSTSSNQCGLLSLPERQDFVFILSRQDLQPPPTSHNNEDDLLVELDQREEFYSSLFRSLGLCQDENNVEDDHHLDEQAKENNELTSDDDHQLSQDENELSSIQPEAGTTRTQFSSKSNLTAQQNRFRKFLNRHLSDIQAAQIDQDNKNNYSRKPVAIVLPRYDDFFTVLLRLKNLFFPYTILGEQQQQASATSAASPVRRLITEQPDERRFIDIFDLVNNDELFSKRHCYKTRLAAFDYYCRDLRSQTCAPSITRDNHKNVLESAKRLYLNHARGSACSSNLDLLLEQCYRYWQNLAQSKQVVDDNKDGRLFRGNRLCKTVSSDGNPSPHSSSQTSSMQNPKSALSIIRRANGVKVVASCECGRQSNFMITPIDRKKKLERVDIHRVND